MSWIVRWIGWVLLIESSSSATAVRFLMNGRMLLAYYTVHFVLRFGFVVFLHINPAVLKGLLSFPSQLLQLDTF